MIIRLVLLTAILLSPVLVSAEYSEKKHRFSVEEIIKGEDEDFYSTEAYIIDISVCPACIDASMCQACAPSVLVAKNKDDEKEKQLELAINPIQEFEIGKRYLLLIQKKKSGEENVREITDYHLIPESLNGR